MRSLDLFLFSTSTDLIARCERSGIAGVVVDWENAGKLRRQHFADTQINYDTVDDLRRVRAATRLAVLCRINGFGEGTAAEVERAIDAGADEILLPMVRRVDEVEQTLALVRGRCGVGAMIETRDALEICGQLARLPIARAYIGLQDLAIERNTPNIFTAIADGTTERVRAHFGIQVGLIGLTLPDRGNPIPCRLLMGELARGDFAFTFLRRAFLADIDRLDVNVEVPRILAAVAVYRARSPHQVALDRAELLAAIDAWTPTWRR